jgi:hypothetical protein
MSPRDQQRVERCHRERIADRIGKLVRGNYASLRKFAEDTALLSAAAIFTHTPEVRRVSRTLIGVAEITKGLQICGLIRSSVVSRNDVVDLDSAFLDRDPA